MGWVDGPVAVLDLAPEKTYGLGGKLNLSWAKEEGIAYFSPLVIPPRLTGRSEEEIWQLAKENFKNIEKCLRLMREHSWSLMIINDVTLYLHHGCAEQLLKQITPIPTVLINGYFGRRFGQSAFSRHEHEEMTKLLLACDQIIFLPLGRTENAQKERTQE
ncbi:MAG: hypothetical protein ACPL5I_10330 [Thermodesulfobacteriota bacterium]